MNPYKLIIEYNYQFTTENGSKYSVYLNNLPEVSGIPVPNTCRLMFLSVKRELYVKGARDVKIGDTIKSIALDYLKKHKHDIVYYICSNSKGQGLARHKLFLKWFLGNNPGNICRENKIISDDQHIFLFDQNNELAKHFLTLL